VAGFNAGNVVSPLDYDFSAMAEAPHNIKELAECKGVIAEPSSVQLQAFQTANAKELQRIRKEAGAPDGEDDAPDGAVSAGVISDALLARLADVDPKKVEAARLRQAKIYAAVCSGTPSAETLGFLPHRIMNAFAEWLSDELMNPEAKAGDGKPPLTIVRSSAAG
jgi:hypothetical protein